MTGGTLPAQTWQEIMAYAHQGIELKPLVGPATTATPPRPEAAPVAGAAPPPPPRPTLLTKNGADILIRIERLMDDARRSMPPMNVSSADKPSPTPAPKTGSFASAQDPAGARQGN